MQHRAAQTIDEVEIGSFKGIAKGMSRRRAARHVFRINYAKQIPYTQAAILVFIPVRPVNR